MTGNFNRSIAFVLKWEGGYVNDPRDPGGETKYGISKKAYPSLDIKALTEDAAREIYRKDYWDKAGCGALEWPLCLVHFDTAVNMGNGRAADFKDRALDWVDYLFLRIEHYAKLNKPEYLRGWLNRVIDLRKAAKEQP